MHESTYSLALICISVVDIAVLLFVANDTSILDAEILIMLDFISH